jgi:hypothetical protein
MTARVRLRRVKRPDLHEAEMAGSLALKWPEPK